MLHFAYTQVACEKADMVPDTESQGGQAVPASVIK
jgi:hypothetical protein